MAPARNKFPLRTVLLMVVALLAFGRLWCATHPTSALREAESGAIPVQVLPRDAGTS
jgi:hypothetical protein